MSFGIVQPATDQVTQLCAGGIKSNGLNMQSFIGCTKAKLKTGATGNYIIAIFVEIVFLSLRPPRLDHTLYKYYIIAYIMYFM